MSDVTLPTVRVKHPTCDGEYMIINAADFNASVHTVFDAPEAPAKAPSRPVAAVEAPEAPAPQAEAEVPAPAPARKPARKASK